jgi:hypothetical protein
LEGVLVRQSHKIREDVRSLPIEVMWIAVEHAHRLSELTELLQKGDAAEPRRVEGSRIDRVEHPLPVV